MKSLLFLAILIYLGIGLYLYLMQRNFIYFPVGPYSSKLEERTFSNEGHDIKVSILNKGNKQAIIYFGGNAENVEFNAEPFLDTFPERTLYLVKYRGYGGSSGTPSEQALFSDALAIYDEISGDHHEISVIGRSLGSAVATYVAAERDIHKLILITPFDSIQSLAQSTFPLYPMSILLKDKYDSLSRAKNIKADTLIIAAENDEIIGMKHTMRLVEGFDSRVEFQVIQDAGHNDISEYPRYYELLNDFYTTNPPEG